MGRTSPPQTLCVAGRLQRQRNGGVFIDLSRVNRRREHESSAGGRIDQGAPRSGDQTAVANVVLNLDAVLTRS